MKKRIISAVMSVAICMMPMCSMNIHATEYSTTEEITEAFDEAVLLDQINSVSNISSLKDIITQNAAALTLDFSYYDKLNVSMQNSVLNQLLSKIRTSSYQSIERFRTDFYNFSMNRYNSAAMGLLNQINSASDSSEIKNVIERNYTILCLDMTYYNEFDDSAKLAVCEYMYGKNFTSVEEMTACFNEAVLLIRINNADTVEMLAHILEENGDILNLDYTYFDMLDDGQREAVLDHILVMNVEYTALEDFISDFYIISEEKYTSFIEQERAELLATINAASEPIEIRQIIEDEHEKLSLDMSYYNEFDDEAKNFVCEYIYDSIYDSGEYYRDIVEVIERFDEAVLLARINNITGYLELQEIVESNRDRLNIDWSRYDKLNENSKIEVFRKFAGRQYPILEEFCKEFENICAASQNSSTNRPSSGGGSGGGGYSGFDTYILTPDKQKLEDEPETGTPVKLVVKAVYQGEPSVSYAAAVYDSEGRLTSVAFHNSKATQLHESEFFEIDTTYDTNSEIKLFKVESSNNFKPLDNLSYGWFEYGTELPVKEEEQDGITAVKGYIETETAGYFELRVTDMRALGYWGVPHPEEPIKVDFSGAELEAYRMIGAENVVYNLTSNEDGTYSISSVDFEGELIHFASEDIYSKTENTLTILVDGKELTYEGNELINFLYEDLSGEYYYAYLSDGKIDSLIRYDYEAKRVSAVGGGRIVFFDGHVINSEQAVAELKVGDIAVLRGDIAYGATSFKAKYYGDVVKAGNDEYSTYYARTDNNFVDGEMCVVYLDPEERHIKYIEKDDDSRELLAVASIENDEQGDVYLSSSNGEIKMTDSVCLDEMIIPAEELPNALDGMLPCAMYVSYGDDIINIESLGVLYQNNSAKYSYATNSIGGYSIPEGKIAVITADGIYEDITLVNNTYYNVVICSYDGIEADYVLIIDEEGTILNTYQYMVVSEWSSAGISGYIDGEQTTIEYVGDFELYTGDIIQITSKNNEIKEIERITPIKADEKTEYAAGRIMFLPVCNVSENCVFMKQGDIRYGVAADSKTEIYMVDLEENTLEKAQLSDIYYNPTDIYSSDWAMVKMALGTDVAEYIVIYKYQ